MTAFADIPQARSGTRLFPGRTEHITAVRSYLAEILDGCPVAEDAILCGSELATNAVIHSRSRQPGGHFAVRAEIRPGEYVQIEVGDQGGPWTGTGHADDRAHGLDIVHALAGNGNWGIKGTASGRVAWARLDWVATGESNGANPGHTEPRSDDPDHRSPARDERRQWAQQQHQAHDTGASGPSRAATDTP